MADKKISQLPQINALSGSSIIVPLVHDSTTQKMELGAFASYVSQWSAKTGSANTFSGTQTFSGNVNVAGNVNVNGRLTVHEIVANYETSSILFSTGSTKLGDQISDKHEFTGSTNITGSLFYNDVLIANIDSNTVFKLQQATASIHFATHSLNTQTGSQDLVNRGISSVTGSINTTTSSFDSVFLRISSTTGSINTTTSSFDLVFLGISSFTGSLNSLTGSYATTGSNTFRGNQNITGSLSISAGEFNVITGSGNMTSSLIFDHTQNDGVTLGLRHNDRLSLADHTFNVQVWAGGVYTTFVRNGTPYSILNVEAFDDNKIYLYRDTRLYNKSLVIDNNLTVQKGVVIGSGSLSIQRGQFDVVSGSGALTSSLSFTHTEVDPITGDATLALRYRNNDVGPENNAWRFVATDNGVQVRYDQYTTTNKLLFSVSSFGSNFDKLLIWRDVRLFGTGLTVDNELSVKQSAQITGSLNVTSGQFTAISASGNLTSSISFLPRNFGGGIGASTFEVRHNNTTYSENIALKLFADDATAKMIYERNGSEFGVLEMHPTGNELLLTRNTRLAGYGLTVDNQLLVKQNAQITGSLIALRGITGSLYSTNGVISSSNQLFELNQQTGSQDLVNLGISSVTGSLIGITNGLMAFTAALDSTYATDVQLYQLYQATASIHFTTQSLNTQSGSQDLVNLGISTFTGSLRSEVNLIEAYTASLKSVGIVSSSTQISNYYKFAETASANTFYGTQTINGNLQLSSTSPLVYNAGNTNAMLFGFFDGSSIYGPYYQIFGSNYSNTTQRGSAEFVFDSRNGGYTGFNIAEFNGSTWLRKFRVSPSGAEVTGSFVVDGGITGSLMATNNVVSSSTQVQNYDVFALNSNLYNSTGSIKGEIAGIEAYTASLKGAIEVSGQNVNVLGMITAQQFNVTYVSSSVLYQSGSTKFGNSFDDTHEFTGSKFEVYNSNASGTMYAVVKNNRSRNAAVKTTTTNGSFIVGTSIGTDVFQYQIYDEVEGTNRITINSQGGTTIQGAITASNALTAPKVAIGSTTTPTIPLEIYGQQKWFTTTVDGSELRGLFNPGGAADDSELTLYKADGTTAGIKLTPNGIDFSNFTGGAGKSSQLLDDYEEGTLTGTITCGTSGTVTLDAGYNTLSYTKIGSIVHVFGLLSVTSVSSPVGYFTIPLPFACANLGDSAATSAATIIVNGTNAANTSDFVGWADETQSSIVVRRGDATGVQNTSANELKALTDIYIQFTYRAN